MEAVVLQPARGQALRRRRRARTAERARRAEADVVEQHHDDVRRPRRRPQRLDGRKRRIRILRVIGDQPVERPVGDRQHLTTGASLLGHLAAPRGSPAGEAPSESAGTGCDRRRTAAAGPVGMHHTPGRARRSRGRRAPRAGSAFGPLSAVETAQIGAESGPRLGSRNHARFGRICREFAPPLRPAEPVAMRKVEGSTLFEWVLGEAARGVQPPP